MVFTLGKLERLIFDNTHIILGSWKSETLNLNISGFKRDIALKQRPDRLSSVGNHIQVITTFEHTWAAPRHTLTGGS